ncbi:MAG: hypothetical protein NTX28_13190, partial [Novosphingobium sp.]|nr:hypothetical protein [Novosphingobium sp.]
MSVENAKVRAIALITEGESFISWMYLDSVSQVTIGYGTMMPNAAAAAGIELRHPDRKLATPDEKRAEWRRLRAISPADTKINYAAEHYRKDAKLFITESEASRLRLLKLDICVVGLLATLVVDREDRLLCGGHRRAAIALIGLAAGRFDRAWLIEHAPAAKPAEIDALAGDLRQIAGEARLRASWDALHRAVPVRRIDIDA